VGDEVAPDGSPIDVYLALPAGETPDVIDSQLRPGSSILELGSGPGRITHALVARGHHVAAVDDSPEMLAHVRNAEPLVGDLFTLDLRRRFDAVVAGSHLINSPDEHRRLQLLGVCRRHVEPDGVVLIERYEPEWAADPRASEADVGDVHISFEPDEVGDERFTGQVVYTLEGRSWTQRFTACAVTDETLAAEAGSVGLCLVGWANESRTWARLEPVEAVT
jgi:SAM-dependent methyltransferase